jgi:hypothetical protein
MSAVAESGLAGLALRVLLGLAPLLSPARAQEDSKPEVFAALDPYSRGERAALDAAGYVALGAFPWCEKISTEQLAREIAIPVLWVETEHFRLGSTLGTYKIPGDRLEKKRIAAELAELARVFPGAKFPSGRLDPWLRLHLYARRIEALHARFLTAFGLSDADFGDAGPDATTLAPGPHLGMPLKFTVFLAERRSSLARLVRCTLQRDATDPLRERLPGDTLFFGISAETIATWGHESDSALHAQVAANVALNLLAGFRGMRSPLPVWFEYGWSHVVSREIDERFTLYARGTQREAAESWDWRARVAGLVANDFAPTWAALADEKRFEDLSGPDHLVAWSKVRWMLDELGPSGLRTYLLAISAPLPRVDELDPHAFRRDRELAVLAELGGGTLAALEEAWRRDAAKATSKR